MYYEKKPCFWSFAKVSRNWRKWVVAAGQGVAGGQMVADGQVVAWSLVDTLKRFKISYVKKGTGQQYFACTWVQDSRIILSA